MFPQQRARPDKHAHRLQWEASWEHDLRAFYSRPLRDLPKPAREPPSPRILALLGTPTHLCHLARKSQEICRLQSHIARVAIPACSNGGFEQKWRNIPDEKRREIVLEGLYNASCVPRLEKKRGLCPDFTLSLLSARDGAEYLRLLREVLLSPPLSGSTSPIFIAHPKIDHIWTSNRPRGQQREIPGLKAYVQDIRLDRAYFASMALWSIFQAYYGEPAERYLVARTPSQTRQTRTNTVTLQDHQDVAAGSGRLRAVQLRACCHCGEPESAMGPKKRLYACGKCMTVGRRIYYCSRGCQSKDLQQGVPPHGAICGKPMETSPECYQQSQDTTGPQIPQPDPSFIRSPDLLRQLSFLCMPPYVDYTFIFPDPFHDQGVFIRPLEDRTAFLAHRDKALRNGDPEAVQQMFRILAPSADGIDYPLSSLKQQLQREYSVTLLDNDTNEVVESNYDVGCRQVRVDEDSGMMQISEPHTGQRQGRSSTDWLILTGMYYISFTFLSCCFMLYTVKFLLRNPLLLILVAPFLGFVLRVLSSLFVFGHKWVDQQ
ncbi:hypothetical protein BC835DRAFT_1324622 [Cytidiella melzeri]|nr:hypothetical protein BC835DRAFT_1324622 [Cytidiella melzeri]